MILHRGDPIVCPITKAETIAYSVLGGQLHISLEY